jgi:hypothetical protein
VWVFQCKRELQWLLCALVYHLFPEFALVSHAVQLGLNVLLRNLQKPED